MAKASKVFITSIAAGAASAASAPQKPAPAVVPKGTPTAPNNKEKTTYNVTVAEIEASEKKAAEKDLERPLRRHWTNFTFYFMASLSVVLPVLFLRKYSLHIVVWYIFLIPISSGLICSSYEQ